MCFLQLSSGSYVRTLHLRELEEGASPFKVEDLFPAGSAQRQLRSLKLSHDEVPSCEDTGGAPPAPWPVPKPTRISRCSSHL